MKINFNWSLFEQNVYLPHSMKWRKGYEKSIEVLLKQSFNEYIQQKKPMLLCETSCLSSMLFFWEDKKYT